MNNASSRPTDKANLICPLCNSMDVVVLFSILPRLFSECSRCDLLFATTPCELSFTQEKHRYMQHNNSSTDPGYLLHLDRMRIQLVPQLKSGACGLDFGCGPDKGMSRLFEASGFIMENYDPFFDQTLSAKERQYDFITCSEVAEHFRDPKAEFKLMQALLHPTGWVSIMTNLREEDRRNPTWWYLRDTTHRSFYSKRTIEYIAGMHSWRVESVIDDVVLFQSQ